MLQNLQKDGLLPFRWHCWRIFAGQLALWFLVSSAFAQTKPIVITQPKSQTPLVGSNVTLWVTVADGSTPSLPSVSSGTLQLWLRADAGTVTNSSGQISQWQDQSGNANHAAQTNTNNQPVLVYPAAIGGKPSVRFNGIQDDINGDYLSGTGNVGLSNAMTTFTVYNAFTTTNGNDVIMWLAGYPGLVYEASRANCYFQGNLAFQTWYYGYDTHWVPPTNTYRIWTDRVNTNLTTLEIFDNAPDDSTNFSTAMPPAIAPSSGYYVGGLNPALQYVHGYNYGGDIAEMIFYQGYLSDEDRLAVVNYLQQKYSLSDTNSSVNYQWRFNNANITGATNATLTLTDVQTNESGSYSVIVSDLAGSTNSSNAVLTVVSPPAITIQPQSQELVQGTNVTFTVSAFSTAPLSYQWFFGGTILAQATNSTLTLTNIQSSNSGSYSVVVSNPFGSVLSSNAVLTVDLRPVIVTQPQSQTVAVGTNVTFSATLGQSLPVVSSGTLQLWLKADAGVVTNSAGLVSQWQDQSGKANDVSQANTNLQPALVSAAGLGGRATVRFNGIQNNLNGSYMHGTGLVNVPNAMTAFTVYNAFSTINPENVLWFIGIPPSYGSGRAAMITDSDLHFSFWAYDFSAPFVVPTNTYRIRTDCLDTNLDTLNMFDTTAVGTTNFTMSVDGAIAPAAGYYLGGLDASIQFVTTSRNFDGDLSEMICYQGSLSDADRLAVTSYLTQKYYQNISFGGESYQWNLNGTNIVGATNASLTLTDVQLTNDGVYSVTISNLAGITTSSDATLAVGTAPSITTQPQSQADSLGTNVVFTVGANGTGPLNYQWSFDSAALSQATNSTLTLSNVAGANSGTYSVVVSSPFGSIVSSNATLTINLPPVIETQPQSQSAMVGTSITFSVTATAAAMLPSVSSGTLQLWLEADAGVVTNSAGLVSQWLDQSGNSNHAAQADTNSQPMLVYPAPLEGRAAVRFNGILNAINGDYLTGTGNIGVSNALTAFAVYNAFSNVVSTSDYGAVVWFVGVPAEGFGADRGCAIRQAQLDFTTWNANDQLPFIVPTNTYRICTDRVNTNLSTVEIFDTSASSETNFSFAMTGLEAPAAGYNVGGWNPSLIGDDHSRCFDGDIAEVIIYKGYLSDADRLTVTSYLEQKYYQNISSNNLSYQWQFDGASIAGATNATLTLNNLQGSEAGSYSVIVTSLGGSVTSSNATLTPQSAIQVVSTNVAGGGTVVVSIDLNAVGTETALGFSLNFDPSVLTYSGVVLGSGAAGNALALNDTQAASGVLGLGVDLFSGAFSPGTNDVLDVTFQATVVTNATTTTLTFGNLPTEELVVGAQTQTLPAVFLPGVLVISPAALEGDVSPRPSGNEIVNIADWVQEARFVAGLDTVSNGTEFQRADCAPRDTLGDGQITVADWVQVGRYAVGLDPLTAAGGPTSPGTTSAASLHPIKTDLSRSITLVPLSQGTLSDSVAVELVAQGDENALSFSVTFDPALVHFTSASLGSGASGAALIQNTTLAGSGNLGFVVGLFPPATFAAGTQQLVRLNFASVSYSNNAALAFSASPVPQGLADSSANVLPANFQNATLTVGGSNWPTLSIGQVGSNLTLSWPSSAAMLGLQVASSPAGPWSNATVTTITNGSSLVVSYPLSTNTEFFRLKY
jgi:hypothetical protein